MNYRKIECIFLFVFLLLNTYLFLTIYEDKKETTINQVDTATDIQKILTSEDIQVNQKLTGHKPEGYYLCGQKVNIKQKASDLKGQSISGDNTSITSDLTANKVMHLKGKYLSQLGTFLRQKDNVYHGGNYRYFKEMSSKSVVVYTTYYKDIPIEDSSAQLEFYIDDHVVSRYHQSLVHPIQEMRDEQELISDKEALYTLYTNNKLSRGDRIRFVRLMYTKSYEWHNQVVYVPTWVVAIDNQNQRKEFERVNAMTNRMIMTPGQEKQQNNI